MNNYTTCKGNSIIQCYTPPTTRHCNRTIYSEPKGTLNFYAASTTTGYNSYRIWIDSCHILL